MAALNASSETLRKLLSNGTRYNVPPFQRDYSWERSEWAQLWEDIEAILKEPDPDQKEPKTEHYMGAVVFQGQGRHLDTFTIIDGQQRLVTLSLLILAAIQVLNDVADEGITPDDNRARAEELHRRYIGDRDPSSLKSGAKLTLNAENAEFYSRQIVQRDIPTRRANLSRSNRLLLEAFQFFQEKLRETFSGNHGEDIARFVNDQLALQLVFIRVDVESEQNAYAVFETLNARGTQLTSADLLKNYLLSVIARKSKSDAEHAHAAWRRIADTVDTRNLPEFLRHYLNSIRSPFTRQERLFKTIKETVETREQAFDLLRSLEAAAVWYRASSDPEDELWNEFPDAKRHVRELVLFGVTQYRSLLLAVGRQFSAPDVSQFLRDCVVLSFRFNIIGNRNTNDLEFAFNSLASRIESREITSAFTLRASIRDSIFPSDDEFREEFTRCEIRSGRRKKLIKYIFCRIERHLSQTDLDFDSTTATIEHILPERGGMDWDDLFPREKLERFAFRLGNYTLLETALNHEAGNIGYANKLPIYHRSQYRVSQMIDAEEWTPIAIDKRQSKLAQSAVAVWRLPD